jgi:hypothetical protein
MKYLYYYSCYYFAFVVFPKFLVSLNLVDPDFGLTISNLILSNILISLATGCQFSKKYGKRDWILPIVLVATFLLSCLTVYNSSALIYIILYLLSVWVRMEIGLLRYKKNIQSK